MATVTEWSTSSAICLAERSNPEGSSLLPRAPYVSALGSPSKEVVRLSRRHQVNNEIKTRVRTTSPSCLCADHRALCAGFKVLRWAEEMWRLAPSRVPLKGGTRISAVGHQYTAASGSRSPSVGGEGALTSQRAPCQAGLQFP